MVGWIMAFQRWPHPSPWNLWTCHLTWLKGICTEMKRLFWIILGDDRGWDGWMASPTQWTWACVNSGSWWWTGRPGVLQYMGSQRVKHDWAELIFWIISIIISDQVREGQEDQSLRCDNGSRGTKRKIGRCYFAGFEDGWLGHKPRNAGGL